MLSCYCAVNVGEREQLPKLYLVIIRRSQYQCRHLHSKTKMRDKMTTVLGMRLYKNTAATRFPRARSYARILCRRLFRTKRAVALMCGGRAFLKDNAARRVERLAINWGCKTNANRSIQKATGINIKMVLAPGVATHATSHYSMTGLLSNNQWTSSCVVPSLLSDLPPAWQQAFLSLFLWLSGWIQPLEIPEWRRGILEASRSRPQYYKKRTRCQRNDRKSACWDLENRNSCFELRAGRG